MRWTAVAISIIILAGCQNTGPSEARFGEEFELAPNQSVAFAGSHLTVGFRRVVGDARCPIDVLCVTDGTAAVELTTLGSSSSVPFEVSSPFPRMWTDGAFRINVLELRPERSANRPIKPEDYRVRLVVDSAAQ